jgi:uncharacterized protein YdeI (YjbR/CyaY-like superfamily)
MTDIASPKIAECGRAVSCAILSISMKPVFFSTPQAFRAWLQKHHAEEQVLWVGLHKKDSGKPSITWPEAVDAALCFGWIDGVRKSLDSNSYTIRFTPRKPRSTWSAINIKRVAELTQLGLMNPAGISAFEKRSDDKSAIYSYEQRKTAQLSAPYEKLFRARKKAWDFFQRQPPWYRRTAAYWILAAKKEETRQKRLTTLIEASEQRQSIAPLKRPGK